MDSVRADYSSAEEGDVAQQEEPSFAELVYEVLRSAERPLTF